MARRVRAEEAAEWIAPHARGQKLFLQGGPAEPRALIEAFAARPELLEGVTVSGLFVPGLNRVDYAALHPQARMETFLMAAELRGSFRDHRISFRPLAYTQAYAALAGARFGAVVIQGAPAPGGRLSLSVSADSALAALANPAPRVALVNAAAPRLDDPTRSPQIDLDQFDLVVACDTPYVTAVADAPDAELLAVARHVADLVPDGATLQFGVGRLPATVAPLLCDRRGLRLHSGMVIDPLLQLLDAGALVGPCVSGIAFGSADLLARTAADARFSFAPVPLTHGAAALAPVNRFFAINAALSVDLFGQVSSDMLGGRQMSGPGGLPDFVRAAQASQGGRAIVALPATAQSGAISRIVPRLDEPALTLARTEGVTIVTEYGVADLHGLDIDGRARALIDIAAPAFRDTLSAGWDDLRRAM